MKPALKSCVLSLALLCVYLTGTRAVSSQAKRFDLDSAAKLARLSDPQITPDGKSIVVVVARANLTAHISRIAGSRRNRLATS